MEANHPNGEAPARERPMGELVKELSQQTSELVRREVDLAKAELAEKGKKAGVGAGMFGAAGLIGVGAFFALTAALILLIAEAVDGWVAALIVAVIYGAIAAVVALQGKNRVQEATPPAPEQTLESVKEDVEWAKTQAKSGRT